MFDAIVVHASAIEQLYSGVFQGMYMCVRIAMRSLCVFTPGAVYLPTSRNRVIVAELEDVGMSDTSALKQVKSGEVDQQKDQSAETLVPKGAPPTHGEEAD